ncbi:hypothetical protein O3M35_002036 [Rhynocoris fuscipes]|uniref:Uncharacterized protein n=1 Tax=Rhynocoris fuscipes TaxID=488301 RepID=A0AAW1CQI8_9HEMI
MLSYLTPTSGRTLIRVKPGLMFLLRLAWESRARLPLLIMSGFMALGVRIQMEINIDRAVRFMPRLRLEDEAFILSDDEGDDEDDDDDEEDDDDEDEDDEEDEDSGWTTDGLYVDSQDYDPFYETEFEVDDFDS